MHGIETIKANNESEVNKRLLEKKELIGRYIDNPVLMGFMMDALNKKGYRLISVYPIE